MAPANHDGAPWVDGFVVLRAGKCMGVYWGWAVLAAMGLMVGMSPAAHADSPMSDSPRVVDLGTLGGTNSSATAENELGQVVGANSPRNRADPHLDRLASHSGPPKEDRTAYRDHIRRNDLGLPLARPSTGHPTAGRRSLARFHRSTTARASRTARPSCRAAAPPKLPA